MKNKLGFTLLELLVVVLIIGILAAIALPQYRKAKDRAKYATIQPIVKAVGEAMERYYMANNSYPARFADIDVSLESSDIQDYHGDDMAFFDWGFCYFDHEDGFFACDLEKETVAFAYVPDGQKILCASARDASSRSYKFCDSMPKAQFVANTICAWKNSPRVECAVFRI